MAWLNLDNAEALVSNARYNARFSAVRLPIVLVVSGFLWQLGSPSVAIAWSIAMFAVERGATYARGRLAEGQTEFALPHLLTLGAMSALWVLFGVLLWSSDSELGRIAATIGLLTTALRGALAGQKDIRPAVILMMPPLLTLFVLVTWHSWTHWTDFVAIVTTLATMGSCVSIVATAWVLNRSNFTLENANRKLVQTAAELSDSMEFLRETSSLAQVGGWRLHLATGCVEWSEQTRQIHEVDASFVPTLENALAFYTPESRPTIEAAVAAARDSGEG